jgi:hypothetical protein
VSSEQLNAEVLAASRETQEELFALLGALRRSNDPERKKQLAEKLDDPSRWVPEEYAWRRLGFADEGL